MRQAIERRFDRPLTAAGLKALYRESGMIDADFWKRHDECHAAILNEFPDKETFWPFCNIELPDRPTAEILARYGRLWRENRAALEAWEACFEQVPPLPAKIFPPGRLEFEPDPEFSSCRSFMRMERSRLILALAGGAIDMRGVPLEVGALSGAGLVTNAPAFTVSDSWTFPAADIANGARLAVDGGLVFGDGFTFAVTGLRDLPASGTYTICTADSINGFTSGMTVSDGARVWKLVLSGDGRSITMKIMPQNTVFHVR